MKPLFAVPKTVRLPGSIAVNKFVRQGLVNDLVGHRRLQSKCYSRLFSKS